MKKYKKIIILTVISLSVYFIYLVTNKNNITYISLGDSLSIGQNAYGGNSYGYTGYFSDYLRKGHNLNITTTYFNSKNKDIPTLYNDILKNESILIDNNNYNLKRLLQEADIITISIGLNDIIYEYSLKNKNELSKYEEDRIISYIEDNFNSLIQEIKKYTTKKIIAVGYPTNNVKYKNLIQKLNTKYKKICQGTDDIFIDSDKLLNNEKYFELKKNLFPNDQGYKKIAENIIKFYENTKK